MSSKLELVEPNAAGIDIGSFSHFVAVPKERDTEHVREFGGRSLFNSTMVKKMLDKDNCIRSNRSILDSFIMKY